MIKNYFDRTTKSVGELAHFPYKNFEEFKDAVKNGEIVDFGIPMDYAREWVTRSIEAPAGWRTFTNLLMLFPYVLVIFYLVSAFWIKNYWLIPYSIMPVIFLFFATPIARRVFKFHYFFIGIYVLSALFLKDLWSPIYWFPLVLVYLSLNQLYEGSAQIVRESLPKKESTVCLFWKRFDLVLYFKEGVKMSQKYYQVGNTIDYYHDVDKEWKNYIKKETKVSASKKDR